MKKTKNIKNVARGINNKRIGNINEKLSAEYVSNHPEIYGNEPRVHIPNKTAFVAVDIYGLWDLLVVPTPPSEKEKYSWPSTLIQTKTNKMPTSEYLLKLIKFSVPSYFRKELHIWHTGKDEPEILEL